MTVSLSPFGRYLLRSFQKNHHKMLICWIGRLSAPLPTLLAKLYRPCKVRRITSTWYSSCMYQVVSQDCNKIHTLSERLAFLGIMEAQLTASLKPINTIVLWWSKGFQGGPQLGPTIVSWTAICFIADFLSCLVLCKTDETLLRILRWLEIYLYFWRLWHLSKLVYWENVRNICC